MCGDFSDQPLPQLWCALDGAPLPGLSHLCGGDDVYHPLRLVFGANEPKRRTGRDGNCQQRSPASSSKRDGEKLYNINMLLIAHNSVGVD